jgi:phytoene dehydrogenase-like protein
MLEVASRIVPGLRERVVFAELGTPLTNVHYCAATGGNLYGTEKSRWQVGPWAFPVKTEIEGLTLCGSSTLSHGVMGAALSGLVAARAITGARFAELLNRRGGPFHLVPSEDMASWPPALRRNIRGRTTADHATA